MAAAVVVGNVIGSGIFLKPGVIAGDSGSFPLIISVWVLGGALCILGALCFAELGTMLPHAGGIYVYLRAAYGDLTAFLFGWSEFLFSRPASIGALAVAFVGSLMLALGWNAPTPVLVFIASVLILMAAGVNIVGVLWGGRVQLVVTFIKAGFLALVAVSPWLLAPLIGESTVFNSANYATTAVPVQSTLAAQIGAVLLAVMWAYNGWHGVTPLAEDIQHPQRNIPLALFGGIGVLIILYIGANLAYHGVLTMDEMKAAGNHAAESMLEKVAGPPGRRAMGVVIMCSTLGAINTNLLQAPRITFAMGRDRTFFPGLGQVHAVYQTPVVSILVMSLMSIALIVTVALAKWATSDVLLETVHWEFGREILASLRGGTIFDLLTNFVIFSASIFYVLAVAAVIVLRRRKPDLERPYRTWGYPVTPLLFLSVYAWFLSRVYVGNPLEAHAGLALIAAGVPVYFLNRRALGRK
jgi:APA family basic amino acid/polyamine antiporter